MNKLQNFFPHDHPDISIKKQSTLHKGFVFVHKFSLQHKFFDNSWSPIIERELITRPACAGVLLYDPEKRKVVLTEQFRLGAFSTDPNPWLIEIVAGMKEMEEDFTETAARETIEESGCTVTKLIPIIKYHASPAITNEVVNLFCGIVNSDTALPFCGSSDEFEDIKTHILSPDQAYTMLENGTIRNAMTIIAIQWLKIHEHKIEEFL